MIRNERQYRTTLRQRQALADALDRLLGERADTVSGKGGLFDDQAQLRLELEQASLDGQSRLSMGSFATMRRFGQAKSP